MRMRLFAAAAAALLVLAPVTPALAADDPGPVLTALSIAQHEVTVSGLDTVLVTVTAHFTDTSDVLAQSVFPDAGLSYWTPAVWFGNWAGDVAFLKLASGTPRDGTWSGQVPVTAHWNGTYKPTRVTAEDADYHEVDFDPAKAVDVPSIVVHSSHRPAIRMDFLPVKVVAGKPAQEYIHVTDSDTGQPLSFANLRYDSDNGCVESTGGPLRAGFWGTAVVKLNGEDTKYNFGQCAWVEGADSFRPIPYPTIIAGVNRSPLG